MHDNKRIIQKGVTGYLVPPENPDEIANKMIYLFNNPESARQMGLKGRKVVEERFSIDRYIRGIEAAIFETLNGHRSKGN